MDGTDTGIHIMFASTTMLGDLVYETEHQPSVRVELVFATNQLVSQLVRASSW